MKMKRFFLYKTIFTVEFRFLTKLRQKLDFNIYINIFKSKLFKVTWNILHTQKVIYDISNYIWQMTLTMGQFKSAFYKIGIHVTWALNKSFVSILHEWRLVCAWKIAWIVL